MKKTSPNVCAFIAAVAIGLSIMSMQTAFAGDDPATDVKETKAVTLPPPQEPWHLEIGVPSWLAASSGTVGLNGNNSHTYTDVATLFRHLNMTGSLSVDARYDRFGFYGDFLYANISQTSTSDGLVGKVSGGLAEWQADMEMYYRVVENDRWNFDLRAGTRYTNMFTSVNIYPNDGSIDTASEKFVDAAASGLRRLLQNELRNSLNNANISLPIAPLAAGQQAKLLTSLQTIKLNPGLAAAIQAQAASVGASAKAAAQARIDAAKNQVEANIANALKKNLNRSFTLGEDWWDPYVGIGVHYNFNKTYYFVGKADIGGFTVGSQITWQGYAGLGVNLSRNIFAEVGYRYLYTNYRSDGFLSDISQSGVQITGGIRF
jgi:opacity protein-like surface antigen